MVAFERLKRVRHARFGQSLVHISIGREQVVLKSYCSSITISEFAIHLAAITGCGLPSFTGKS